MPRKVFIASHYFPFLVFCGLRNYWLFGQHLWGLFGHQLEICLKERVQQTQRVFYTNFTCDLRIANRNMLFLTCHFSKIFPQMYATYSTLSSFPSWKRKHSFFFPPHFPTLASFYHAQLRSELLVISISWVVKRSDSCKPPVWVFPKGGAISLCSLGLWGQVIGMTLLLQEPPAAGCPRAIRIQNKSVMQCEMGCWEDGSV